MHPPTISWKHRTLHILDQTLLPASVVERRLETVEAVWDAIKTLKVRGAPAIGVCAAYGVVVGVLQQKPQSASDAALAARHAADYLATSRPTAVNLFWALDRMTGVASRAAGSMSANDAVMLLEREALAIHEEDRELCRSIGRHGSRLIQNGCGVLTHCNAGGLATSEYGTALSILYAAHEEGRRFRAYADETRPLLQGARLTAWELMQSGIDTTLICDNMAAQVMRERKIDLVVVGADRIAANGDTANKIGTYGLALLAKAHGIPFYIAAPYSTFDHSLADGSAIPIEERDAQEVTCPFGVRIAPSGVNVYNPAFDVTPFELISGFITESGIVLPPFAVHATQGDTN